MKELLNGILAIIGSSLITVTIFWYLILHQIVHAIYMTVTLKDWKSLFRLAWRTVDGTFAVIGYLLYHIAYSQDLLWNVYGEAIEDVTTSKEDTLFGNKEVSVSAAIGKEEYEGRLVPSGKIITKILNVAFWQKQHAIDSWLFYKSKKELESKFFEKRK